MPQAACFGAIPIHYTDDAWIEDFSSECSSNDQHYGQVAQTVRQWTLTGIAIVVRTLVSRRFRQVERFMVKRTVAKEWESATYISN